MLSMKTSNTLILAASLAAVVLAATTAGWLYARKTFTEAAPAVVKENVECFASGLDDTELYETGYATVKNKAIVTPWKALQCGTYGVGYLLADAQSRQPAHTALGEHLLTRPAYLQGLYAGIAPANMASEQAKKFSEVGLLIDQVRARRAKQVACGQADEATVAYVAQLDETFVLGSTLRYVKVDNVDEAQRLAQGLLKASEKPASLAFQPECGAALTDAFKADVTTWLSFYQGKHPWAPGCKVAMEESAFVLQCR